MFGDLVLNDFVIVGIDPGVSHMGMSAITISPDLRHIRSIYAATSHGDHADIDVTSSYHIDERYSKLLHHKSILSRWLYVHRPSYVVYEKPFMYGNKPNAYGALVESITAIKDTTYYYNRFIDIYEYTPLNIKKTVHAANFQGKDFVLQALLNIPEIKNKMDLNLDEHSVDAIAIAYTHLVNLRNGLV